MPGPKPQLLLQEWIPRNNEEVDRLFRFMVDHGVNARTARSTIGRLMTLPRESPLTNSQLVERARLRKLLASLGEPPWDPDREPAVIELSPLSSVEPLHQASRWARHRPLNRPVPTAPVTPAGSMSRAA